MQCSECYCSCKVTACTVSKERPPGRRRIDFRDWLDHVASNVSYWIIIRSLYSQTSVFSLPLLHVININREIRALPRWWTYHGSLIYRVQTHHSHVELHSGGFTCNTNFTCISIFSINDVRTKTRTITITSHIIQVDDVNGRLSTPNTQKITREIF